MNKIVIAVIFVLVGIGAYLFLQSSFNSTEVVSEQSVLDTLDVPTDEVQTENGEQEEEDKTKTIIGESADGRDITAYHYGRGDTELLFVGGIHGGYAWNTVLVAYELIDYLEESPEVIPENVTVTVIPVLNPDGLDKTVGSPGRFTQADVPPLRDDTISGRFNARGVDLNRNFDCDWQSVGTWQNRTVSGGDEVFSEPESQAMREYVRGSTPSAVVVWYSAVGGVFASNCHDGILSETREITNIYADASEYSAFEEFDFYNITGDMVNWLAGQQVPAISILLTTHEDVEWDKNKRGIGALLKYYAE